MSEELFKEAIRHCRWKYAVKSVIPKIQLKQPAGTTFDKVFEMVHALTAPVEGVGLLSTYDLASAVCRYNRIPIKRVYIIGEGPQKAIKYLGLTTASQKIGSVTLKYVTVDQVKNSKLRLPLPPHLKNTTDGDALETFLCNWQKPLTRAYDLC